MNETEQDQTQTRRDPRAPKCPYIEVHPSCKICKQTHIEVSAFDTEHFCETQPLLCYYYRATTTKPESSNTLQQQDTHNSF